MAIPFSLPSDDTTLEQYRSIHQLLLDLTAILRALMVRNPEWIRPNNIPNTNYENIPSPACAASPAVLHNAASSPQFVFPLSPPNSQPGSPSPFFSTTATGSAFVLPDVVANAAATAAAVVAAAAVAPSPPHHNHQNSAHGLPATVPAGSGLPPMASGRSAPVRLVVNNANNLGGATATASNVAATTGANVLDATTLREKLLRKRKRAKLTKRKKVATGSGDVYEAQRKVARTGATICACAGRSAHETEAMTVDDDSDGDSMADPTHRLVSEYLLRGYCAADTTTTFAASASAAAAAAATTTTATASNATTSTSAVPEYVPTTTVHSHSCCLHHQKPSVLSSTHPRHSGSECGKVPVCMHVGEELRKIVECFRNPKELADNMSTDDMESVKGAGFMSQFGRTMFTAALLVIGWKLLKQN